MADVDLISCSSCHKMLPYESLRRHSLRVHNVVLEPRPRGRRPRNQSTGSQSSTSKSVVLPSRSSSVSLDRNTPSTQRNTIRYMFGDMDPAVSAAVSVAANGILEQHDTYGMPSLIEYVKSQHVDVPPSVIPYVITSATAAAKYVAQKFYVRERYMNSSQLRNQELSENVANWMLGWFTGLRPQKCSKAVKNGTPSEVQVTKKSVNRSHSLMKVFKV
jgi:hypothetical protein